MPTRRPPRRRSSVSAPVRVSCRRTVRSADSSPRAVASWGRRPAWTPASRAGGGRSRARPSSLRRGTPTASSGACAMPEVRRPQVPQPATAGAWCSIRSCVVLAPARDGLGEPRPDPDRDHDRSTSEFAYSRRAPAAGPRPPRGRPSACRPTSCSASDSRPPPRLLGLRRAPLDEPHRDQREERELQVLRLPVLGPRLGEVPRREVAAEGDGLRRPAEQRRVLDLLLVVVVPAGDRLAGEGDQEEREEDEGEPCSRRKRRISGA